MVVGVSLGFEEKLRAWSIPRMHASGTFKNSILIYFSLKAVMLNILASLEEHISDE